MTARTASAAVGLPLLTVVIWLGLPWLALLVAALAALAALELCGMARKRGSRPPAHVAAVWAVALVFGGHLVAVGAPIGAVAATVAGAWMLGLVTRPVWRVWSRAAVADLAIAAGAAVYAGGLLAYGPMLRGLEDGREWLFLAVIATFAADTSAFVVGRSIGKRLLAPKVSPAKTWEGAIGGLLGAMGATAALVLVFALEVTLVQALTLGALMGVVGQMGDLGVSKLKRASGVKDSGWLIPGHGGVVDRLDSIVFNLFLVYYFSIWAVQ